MMRTPFALLLLVPLLVACPDPGDDDDSATPAPTSFRFVGDVFDRAGDPAELADVWYGGEVTYTDAAGHYEFVADQNAPLQIDVIFDGEAHTSYDAEREHVHRMGVQGFGGGGEVTLTVTVEGASSTDVLMGEVGHDGVDGPERTGLGGRQAQWNDNGDGTFSIDTRLPQSAGYSVVVSEVPNGTLRDYATAHFDNSAGQTQIELTVNLDGTTLGEGSYDASALGADVAGFYLAQLVEVQGYPVAVTLKGVDLSGPAGSQTPLVIDDGATLDANILYYLNTPEGCDFAQAETEVPGGLDGELTIPGPMPTRRPTTDVTGANGAWSTRPNVLWSTLPSNAAYASHWIFGFGGPGTTWVSETDNRGGETFLSYPEGLDSFAEGQVLAALIVADENAYAFCGRIANLANNL